MIAAGLLALALIVALSIGDTLAIPTPWGRRAVRRNLIEPMARHCRRDNPYAARARRRAVL